MPRRRKPPPKRHVKKDNTRYQCSKPLPPILYESAILKGVNGVEDIQTFYGHFSNSKLEEYLPYLNQCIFGIKDRIKDCRQTEQHLDLIYKHLEARILALDLDDNDCIQLSQKEIQNIPYKLTPVSHIDLENIEKEMVTKKILPVFTECFKICNNTEMFLMLLAFVSQGLLHISGHQVEWEGYEFNLNRLSHQYPVTEQKDDELAKLAENMLRTILIYSDCIERTIGNDRYINLLSNSLCDRRIDIQFKIDRGLNKYYKNEKAGLINKLEKLWFQYVEDAETLYALAEQCKTDEKKTQVSITAAEMAAFDAQKVEAINRISLLKSAVEQNLEENKRRIIGNAEFELFEREKDINKAASASYIFVDQQNSLRRLELERNYWMASYKRKVEKLQKYYGQSKLSMKIFNDTMIEYINSVPEVFQKSIEELVNLQQQEIKARNFLAEKKAIRSHFTNKIRQQYCEHNDVIIQSLTDDLNFENYQYSKKNEIHEKIKRDCTEARYSFHRSFTIPSYFPKRLEPPFPSSSMDQSQHRSQRISIGSQQANPIINRNNTPNSSHTNNRLSFDSDERNDRRSSVYEITVHQMESSQQNQHNRSPKRTTRRNDTATTSTPTNRIGSENDRDKRPRELRDENGKGKKRKVEERPNSKSVDKKEDNRQKVVTKKKRYDENDTDLKGSDCSIDSLNLSETNGKKITNGTSKNGEDLQVTPDSSVFYTLINMKELKGTLSNILGLGMEQFMRFILPMELSNPLNCFPSFVPEVKQKVQMVELCEEDELKYINQLVLFFMLKYVHSECSFQISLRASQDFLDQKIFPYEIARQIIHNQGSIIKMKSQFEQQNKHASMAYKVKVQVACGLINVLTRCINSIDKLYELENSELTMMRDQAKSINGHEFVTEHLKQLNQWIENFKQAIQTVNLRKSIHQKYLTYLEKLKEILTNRLTITKRKERALEAIRQRITQSNEAKEKRLEEIRQRYAKLGDTYKQSCIKYSEADINYTKKKLAYNIINDDLKRADSAPFRPDPVTEALHKKYKEMLLCPTCKVRQKDCALTKCYHLFCEECIVNLYKSRNRKCPECNTRVGVNEYKRVFI